MLKILVRQIYIFFLFVFLLIKSVGAEEVARSGPQKVFLIEAFTSEGCSSCWPAWKWMNQAQQNPQLWKDFVIADFHVDYWNYLGWKDPFSRSVFSNRQRLHAASWEHPKVYTPGFMLDGREWRGWYGPNGLERLKSEAVVGRLALNREKADVYQLFFQPQGQNSLSQSYEAHMALLAFDVFSNIKRGAILISLNQIREIHIALSSFTIQGYFYVLSCQRVRSYIFVLLLCGALKTEQGNSSF